jgi:hypothetical protein
MKGLSKAEKLVIFDLTASRLGAWGQRYREREGGGNY